MDICEQCGKEYTRTKTQRKHSCKECVQANKNARMYKANAIRVQQTTEKILEILSKATNFHIVEKPEAFQYDSTLLVECKECGSVGVNTVGTVLSKDALYCKQCNINARRLTEESLEARKLAREQKKHENRKQDLVNRSNKFMENVISIYGDKYDMSKIVYLGNKHKVTVICKEHGEFSIRPNDLLMGHGCRQCAIERASYSYHRYSDKPCYIYLVHIAGTELYKIGITEKTLKARYKSDYELIEEVHMVYLSSGAQAWELENYLTHVVYKDYKYTGEPKLMNGNSEIITKDISGTFVHDLFKYAAIAKEYYERS